ECRFDDDGALCQVVERSRAAETIATVFLLLGRDRSFLGKLREGLFDCRETFLNQVVRNLAYSSFKARHRRRLRDARTHQATTKHADLFYFHFNLLIIRRLPGYRTASGSDRIICHLSFAERRL